MTTLSKTLELDLTQHRLWVWVDHRGALILLTDYINERELTDAEVDALGDLVDMAKAARKEQQ